MSMATYTPGPWRWEINEKNKVLHLVGGDRPMYDLTVLEPVRWGMGGATVLLRDELPGGLSILHRVHERRDWMAPFDGRSHHARWCANVIHPDMRLIAAAPELVEALRQAKAVMGHGLPGSLYAKAHEAIDAVLAKVEGTAP